MVRQIVTSGELLMTVLALVIPTTRKIRQAFCCVMSDQKPSAHATDLSPGSRVLRHVPLPIALDGELESALVANKRFHSAVRAHVLLKEGFAKVRLREKVENVKRKKNAFDWREWEQ